MMKGYKLVAWRIGVAVLILASWQGLSGPVYDSFWFSRPSLVAEYLWTSATSGELWNDLALTFRATAIGYFFGAIGGLFFGLLIAQSEKVALVLKPFVLAVYGIPRIALAPLFILWFGIALTSKVMMAAMVTFLLVFFNTYEGVRAADLDLRNVARVLGANRWQIFRSVTIPNASPWIIAGLRISIPQALVAAVVAELIASSAGLGYRMMENTNQMDTAGTMAGILILMAIVVILNSILDKAEDHFLRWRPKESDTQKD